MLGIVLYLLHSNLGFLTLADVSGYTRMNFNDGGIIVQGQASIPFSYNGHSYQFKVQSAHAVGQATGNFYKDGVAFGGTFNSPAPDCPSCSDYWPTAAPLESGVLGNILCYTASSTTSSYTAGQTFCYASIYFSTTPQPTTCVYNGQTYQEGQQVKLVNGCYSTWTGKACSTNYQFSTCLGGKLQGYSICYPGDGTCGQQPICSNTCASGQLQKPYPDCSCYAPDQCPTPATVNCTTSDKCPGTQTCSNSVWGACLKTDEKCGQAEDKLLVYGAIVLLTAAGLTLVIYGIAAKRKKK